MAAVAPVAASSGAGESTGGDEACSVEERFRAALEKWESGVSDDDVEGMVLEWQACGRACDAADLWSKNECIGEVKTADLRFLLCDYFLGLALQRNTATRLESLKRARVALTAFIATCSGLELVPRMERAMLGEEETSMTAAQHREAKIARYKADKVARQRLEVCVLQPSKFVTHASHSPQALDAPHPLSPLHEPPF
jgi:hypothetical protein